MASLEFNRITVNNAQKHIKSTRKVRNIKRKRFCTFNCQGLLNTTKQTMLADDFKSYRLSAMAVQETHMKNSGIHILTSTSGEVLYLYYSGNKEKSRNGVGIIVNTNTKVSFKPISDRICMLTTNFNDKNQVTIISVYAPTLESTRKSPEETINFYNDLNTVINLVKSRDTLLICGDFNAKAKPKNDVIQEIFMKNIGKYGKGELNENGQYLPCWPLLRRPLLALILASWRY